MPRAGVPTTRVPVELQQQFGAAAGRQRRALRDKHDDQRERRRHLHQRAAGVQPAGDRLRRLQLPRGQHAGQRAAHDPAAAQGPAGPSGQRDRAGRGPRQRRAAMGGRFQRRRGGHQARGELQKGGVGGGRKRGGRRLLRGQEVRSDGQVAGVRLPDEEPVQRDRPGPASELLVQGE